MRSNVRSDILNTAFSPLGPSRRDGWTDRIGLKFTYTPPKPEILRLAFIDLYRMTLTFQEVTQGFRVIRVIN